MNDMREHRRTTGATNVLILAGLVIGIPTCMAGATTWGSLILGFFLVLAVVTYYK